VSLLFLNSWRVRVVTYYVTAHPPAIQKQLCHSRKTQIEPPLIECISVSELLEYGRSSVVPYYVTTHPPAIQKQH
jgi:hypothetical protein